MKRIKQNMFWYRTAQLASFFVATFLFKRKMLRNEIKGVKGPYVVIANHQAAYDFVNLIGAVRRPLTFVISNSFYNSLPIKGILKGMGVIPKQQFQTTLHDMKRMKSAVEQGKPLVIYPAGLMCEDGLSTPIPKATYKFLKWVDADVYVAKSYGTYFCMPKWTKGIRVGETQLDIYKLFSREQLEQLDVDEIKRIANKALLFDAYREQEQLMVKYKNGDNLQGLENVLYMCPHCKAEFSVKVRDKSALFCEKCGFEQRSDEYAFLHNTGGVGEEIRYVSDWSRIIHDDLMRRIESGEQGPLSAKTKIHMIDYNKNRFVPVGEGEVTLSRDGFVISAVIRGEKAELTVPITSFASLPASPGKHFEIQHGDEIYRCVPEDGRLTMKFINMVKIFYEMSRAASSRA